MSRIQSHSLKIRRASANGEPNALRLHLPRNVDSDLRSTRVKRVDFFRGATTSWCLPDPLILRQAPAKVRDLKYRTSGSNSFRRSQLVKRSGYLRTSSRLKSFPPLLVELAFDAPRSSRRAGCGKGPQTVEPPMNADDRRLQTRQLSALIFVERRPIGFRRLLELKCSEKCDQGSFFSSRKL
jgi:hypothetical protein